MLARDVAVNLLAICQTSTEKKRNCTGIFSIGSAMSLPRYLQGKGDFAGNQQLSELRDWLLPMLMNGQVTVKDMEAENLSVAAEPGVWYGKRK